MFTPDILVIGAGAAGLMCAATAAARGKRVVVVDHAAVIGEKIRISGGGRCNFTNIHAAPDRYLSSNPHFCKSALARYTQHDFIKLVQSYGIAYHEKTLGQLFCDGSATQIIDLLLSECKKGDVMLRTGSAVESVQLQDDGRFMVRTNDSKILASALVVATGGLSIPKIGATPFGYELAKQFGHSIIPPRAGLVPLTFGPDVLEQTKELAGVAVDPVDVKAQCGKTFREALLFTHRGLSGPAILQISSYWNLSEPIEINLLPDLKLLEALKQARGQRGKAQLETVLAEWLPKRLADFMAHKSGYAGHKMADLSDAKLQQIEAQLAKWRLTPMGTEGYRTAEVTIGGVDTREISSKTMESQKQKGLFFVGEVMDVTGHLGGYNFQWAWSSGWVAGQHC